MDLNVKRSNFFELKPETYYSKYDSSAVEAIEDQDSSDEHCLELYIKPTYYNDNFLTQNH